MKSLFRTIGAVLSSRATSPAVIGMFLLVYIVLAFGTDDTLTALMAVTASSLLLKALLALLPLSSAARLYLEMQKYLNRRRVLAATSTVIPEGLFDETVELPACASLEQLQGRLAAAGYATKRTEEALSAWRGASLPASRLLFLAGSFCLFAGILISISSRVSHRDTVLEGQPIPTSTGGGGMVEKITLGPSSGTILASLLTMEVGPSEGGDARKVLGLYPPSLYRGNFVYPRYLGISPLIRFSAPDLPAVHEAFHPLNIYPAGKEEKAEIPASAYRIDIGMAEPVDGSDPFVTGRITLLFKLFKGKDLLFAGAAPIGGEFVRDGYRLAFPDVRRMVITDFVRDYGVLFIWTATLLFGLAALVWLPVRALFPRREMGFIRSAGVIRAYSRAEGARRSHGGAFHEALDLFESRVAQRPAAGE